MMKENLREENMYLANHTKVIFVSVVWTKPELLISLGIGEFHIDNYRN